MYVSVTYPLVWLGVFSSYDFLGISFGLDIRLPSHNCWVIYIVSILELENVIKAVFCLFYLAAEPTRKRLLSEGDDNSAELDLEGKPNLLNYDQSWECVVPENIRTPPTEGF